MGTTKIRWLLICTAEGGGGVQQWDAGTGSSAGEGWGWDLGASLRRQEPHLAPGLCTAGPDRPQAPWTDFSPPCRAARHRTAPPPVLCGAGLPPKGTVRSGQALEALHVCCVAGGPAVRASGGLPRCRLHKRVCWGGGDGRQPPLRRPCIQPRRCCSNGGTGGMEAKNAVGPGLAPLPSQVRARTGLSTSGCQGLRT